MPQKWLGYRRDRRETGPECRSGSAFSLPLTPLSFAASATGAADRYQYTGTYHGAIHSHLDAVDCHVMFEGKGVQRAVNGRHQGRLRLPERRHQRAKGRHLYSRRPVRRRGCRGKLRRADGSRRERRFMPVTSKRWKKSSTSRSRQAMASFCTPATGSGARRSVRGRRRRGSPDIRRTLRTS